MSKFKLYDIILCKSNKNINIFHKTSTFNTLFCQNNTISTISNMKSTEKNSEFSVPSVVGYNLPPWWVIRLHGGL